MIDGLLKITEILLGRGDKLEKVDADRRRRISLYFKHVSRCLSDIAMALKAGTEPWEACAELEEYNYQFNPWDKKKDNLVVQVFGKELAEQIEDQLFALTESRRSAIRVLTELRAHHKLPYMRSLVPRGNPSKLILTESIIKIQKAAGHFKALSVLAKSSSKVKSRRKTSI